MTSTLAILNTQIRQDAEGRFCLNDCHKAAGGKPKDAPAQWLRTESAKRLVAALVEEGVCNSAQAPTNTVNDGKNNGTYACRELIYAYGEWIIGQSYSDMNRTGGGQIKSAWAFACRRAGLPGHERVWTPKNEKWPKRQFVPDMSPHCLRHTFATWHYCAHKDLLRLKEEGGWQTITMVTRYAKKMPDYYRAQIMRWWSYTDWPEIAECVPFPGQAVKTDENDK